MSSSLVQAYRKVLARRAQGLPEGDPEVLIADCAEALQQLRPSEGQTKIVGFGSQTEPEDNGTASQMMGWFSSGFNSGLAKAQAASAKAQDKLVHKAGEFRERAHGHVAKAKVKAKELKETAKYVQL